jgi:hypothetical protein
MKEKRIYGIDLKKCELDNITFIDDNDFINEAENQGLVWSLKGFESDFNKNEILDTLYIRVI